MNNYAFEILSPIRFEQLVRDLLRVKYGDFENFAEGKDGGIDFRYSQSNGKILIIQCKKYKSVNNLLSNLKREAEKAQNIRFNDYLLVVSLNLTDTNKSKILELYKGNIKRPDQIITNEDLNHLLGLPENHHVEFKFPELWMNSISVHQKIFHLGFLPLKRATKMLKALNSLEVLKNARAINEEPSDSKAELKKKSDELYNDIDDQTIEDIIRRIKSNVNNS